MATRPQNLILFATVILHMSFRNCATLSLYHNNKPVQTFSVDNRIIGGRPARPGELPYQLQMRVLDIGHVCGATLVRSPHSDRLTIAITAAHCVVFENTTDPYPKRIFEIRAGTTGVNETGQTLTIRYIAVHPGYTPLNTQNGSQHDIAVLFLYGQFTLNRFVQPLPLPKKNQQTTGNVMVSGWGITNSSSHNASPVLRVAVLPVLNSTNCNRWYRNETSTGANVIHPTNICAGYPQGGQNACRGDSGGPMVGYANGKGYLAGVSSWGGKFCEAPRRPSVFTKVSSYIDWIDEISDYL